MTEELEQKAEDFFKRFYRVFDDELEYAKENNDEGVINTIKMLVEFAEETTKELQEENKQAKEIIKKYLVIGVGGKITQNYLDVTKEAEAFLKE